MSVPGQACIYWHKDWPFTPGDVVPLYMHYNTVNDIWRQIMVTLKVHFIKSLMESFSSSFNNIYLTDCSNNEIL